MIKDGIEAIYALSPMQQGMLFQSLYAPESGVYFQHVTSALRGRVDVAAFERAWQQVVDRYQVLRTAFVWQKLDKPLQVVHQRVKVSLEQHDFEGLSPEEQESRLEDFLRADLKRGFELSKAPLMRLALIRMGEDSYQFIWSHHHLLLDGWSVPILVKEVFAYYEAYSQGKELHLQRGRPYRDYIAWLKQQDLKAAEAYWRQTLAGFDSPTPLGVDQPLERTLKLKESYAEQIVSLSAETTARLQSLARQHQLTLNTVVQGAWALLLSRYSNHRDIVFGVTVSGRPPSLAGSQTMVGMFINTLPVRVRVVPEEGLLNYFKEFQDNQVEMRQYEYSPLVQVQTWSDVERGLPLFESMLVFENYPVGDAENLQDGTVDIDKVSFVEQRNFTLTVLIDPATELGLRITYDERRFDGSTIARMAQHYITLLEGICSNIDRPIFDLPLLTDSERHQLLHLFNSTAAPFSDQACIHDLVRDQVELRPEQTAVVFQDQEISYQELERRSNQVANYLIGRGVRPELRVGVCLERGIEMIVGVLGILKAGGAYVPLDPAYPADRLSYMIEDAQIPVLLTEERWVGTLPADWIQVIALDSDWDMIARESADPPQPAASSGNLAYVIYTSGSTGEPKGVMINHSSLVNHTLALSRAQRLAPLDRHLQFVSLSFDASAEEIFPTLISGATLVLHRNPGQLSGPDLLSFCRQQDVSVLHVPPALWHQVVDDIVAQRATLAPSVRTFLTGGEGFRLDKLREFAEAVEQPVQVLNAYGPTEATITTTFYETYGDHQPDARDSYIPIGKPIANAEIFVLDQQMQLVPVGVGGELFIAGAGVARGYLNRPDLTADRFIPNAYATRAGDRVYRTGDVVRYLRSGDIEFIGRTDQQVKLRGYRIELAEIEAVLSREAGVTEAAVIVKQSQAQSKQLVAYVVGEGSWEELKRSLSEKVPDYMVPSKWVRVERMPLTPNGKVDRRALEEREGEEGIEERGEERARTQVEEILAGIWEKVLGVEKVGIHDNFFDLGGHSLLATQLISRVRECFDLEVSLPSFFEGPTIEAFAAHIENTIRAEHGTLAPPVEPAPRDIDLPLSFAQQRLWFLDQLEPGVPVYNLPAALSLSGNLDVGVAGRIFTEIVRRHESLRTNFTTVDGKPVQVISPARLVKLPVIDLMELPDAEREATALKLMNEEAQRPFDLAADSLLRVSLLRLADDRHVLLLTMHHILSDGWSLGVLVHEVASLYDSYANGSPSQLPELPIQYADFAYWQRQWLQGEVLEEQLRYWKEQLGGELPVLSLPTDRPRPAEQSFRGSRESVVIGEELSERLKAVSRREGVTMFMVLLAAFKTLLYRYTNQEDIIVGTDIANRNRVETEGLIGFFVNMLAMRTKVSGDQRFSKLLGRVREVTLGAYAHQDLPFEKLIEEIQPDRDLARSPLFQVVLDLENAPMQNLDIPGLTLSMLAADSGTAKYDLSLSLTETADRVAGVMEYNADLFDGSTIARMAQHYITLLEGICSNIDRPIFDLPLLTDSERHQLLHLFNSTAAPFSDQACIHDLVRDQVEVRPEQTAVVFQDQEISYQELERRSNQVANYLIGRGVRPELRVGVCLERGIEMIVGVLGILKAGGAYVPLDPAYPADRLTYMIDDSDLSLLLAHQHLIELLPPSKAEVVCIDKDWQRISLTSPEYAGTGVRSHNLAYVIYTSGSTGKPKGVQIEHRSVVNFLETMMDKPGLSQGERLMAVTSLSFDIAGLELMLPLVVGAVVVMTSRQEGVDARELMKKMDESRSRVMQATPATWAMMMEGGWEGSAEMRVLCGGEALRWELGQELKRVSREVWSLYGPTETTIWLGIYEVRVGDRRVPIGKPIGNTQMYVMDGELGVVPIGAQGEVYIAGEGVARGYLNNAEATAERFIPNPMSAEQGSRLYRTGDVGRHLQDGNIEFLGRTDHQVKIRGYRIELGEIEEAMRSHERVKEAVVVVREEAGGEKQLVGYVRSEVGEEVEVEELREYLRGKVAEYMMPSVMMKLEQMPLTPNGKVDRKALPAPVRATPDRPIKYTGPRTPVEEVLVGIWSQVLRVEDPGIEDDFFFDLGGHSLLATQVISRVRETFQVEVPLRKLFESSTIARLARQVEAIIREGNGLMAIPLAKVPRDEHLPLSFAQQRLWFIDQLQPDNPAYNIPAAMKLTGELNLDVLKNAVNEVARRHESLRTSFISADGQPLQVISDARTIPVPVIDLSGIPATEREAGLRNLVLSGIEQPFDLSRGPLFRLTLFRISPEQHVALVVKHHIISDEWSMAVFIQEIATLYDTFLAGNLSPLAELPIQYVDFASWQRYALSGEALEKQLSYWKQNLGGDDVVLELPTDRPRPPVRTFNGAHRYLTLSESLSRSLKSLSHEEEATLFMILLAGFDSLLHHYTGEDEIRVGSPIANRNRPELEGLIGFFVNTLVMRANFAGAPTFRELLRRVRDNALEAYGHQDLPFEQVVEALHPERDLNNPPLFQVMFVMQQAPAGEMNLHGLTMEPFEIEVTTVKYDLTMTATDTGQEISIRLGYNTDLFDEASIDRMQRHYETLLERVVADPDQKCSQTQMLTDAEALQILVEWNDTAAEHGEAKTLHRLFEEQVERTPHNLAAVFQYEEVTYRELNRRANQMAHHLRGLGVGPDTIVGLCAERSLAMVIGLLGILKAGGAYLPLDPAFPKERLAFMLDDSQSPVLVTQQHLLDLFSEYNGRAVCVDSDWERISRESEENPDNEATLDNLAYVIYTSGSTGKPKGVLIEQRQILNYMLDMRDKIGVRPETGFAMVQPLTVDSCKTVLFTSLFSGAALHVISRELASDARGLAEYFRDYRIDFLKIAPSHLAALHNSYDQEMVLPLECLVMGGEAPHRDQIKRIQRRAPALKIMNHYGPTETTVAVLNYTVTRDSARDAHTHNVPTGRPISNTQVYILDSRLQPGPVGIPGELYISGDSLGRGYLGNPALTAETFIPNPFSREPGARMYKTGDIARYMPDGNVEFLGRGDHQIKVRGFRVEAEEVEKALFEHPAVKDTIVTDYEVAPGDKRLVAYIVASREESVSPGELRAFMAEKVPDYMIPSAFMFLDAMPLSAQGKVNRRALPPPGLERPEVGEAFVEPRTETERMLADIWSQVLGVKPIGIHDNFFNLGGHSLLATQVISRVSEAVGKSVPLRLLFEFPTVAGLARQLDESGITRRGAPEQSMQAIPRRSRSIDQQLAELSQLSEDESKALIETEMQSARKPI